MKSKHLFILAAVMAALLAVNLFQKIHSEKKETGEVRREEWHPMIPQEKAANVIFSRPDFPALELVKEGDDWKVKSLGGISADQSKVTALINQLNQMKSELRAEGEDLYERFGISEKEAFRIQIEDSAGAKIVDFSMSGKRSGKGVFIRLAGKAKIYFTADDVPALFGLFGDLEKAAPQPLFFTDLRLVPENFEQIQYFEVVEFLEDKKIPLAALKRGSADPGAPWKILSSTWKFSTGADKVENYLNRLTGSFAQNIETQDVEFKPSMEVMLRDGNGKVLRLEFSKSGTEWLVKRDGVLPLFQISTLVSEDLKTEDAHFAGDNPLQLKIDEIFSIQLIHEGKTETFSKASNGWPSAAAILDSAMKLQFTGMERGIQTKDLSGLPPTHVLRVLEQEKTVAEITFYVIDPKLEEIKVIISGQDQVFKVSRAFFESIFVPATPPVDGVAVGSPLL